MFDTPLFANITSGLVTVGAELDAAEVESRLVALDWQVCPVDCATATDKEQLIAAIGTALSFPDWTGSNWDALSDAVTDLSWLDANRVALVLHETAALADTSPGAWRTAKEILTEAVEWWTDRPRALLVVLH